MKSKEWTDDRISSLASPSVISQTVWPNCANNITTRGRPGGVDKPAYKPAHSGEGWWLWLPISMIDWDYFLVSFKSFQGPAESLELVFRKHWVHHLPRFLAFWLKSPLLSNNICEYWFCKQWAAGLDSFHNTLTVLFWSVEIPIPLLVCKHFSDWTIIIRSLLLLL